jgi:hypothetical protein
MRVGSDTIVQNWQDVQVFKAALCTHFTLIPSGQAVL